MTTFCGAAALWALLAGAASAASADVCAQAGVWIDPSTGARIAVSEVIGRAAERPVVLLGEAHDNADHHRWQLYVLAALHAQRPNLVIGLEMLPRRKQPVLDAWLAGALGEAEFVEQSEWGALWGYDAAMYLPILHFARQYRVPLLALNVERNLVRQVGEVGWENVPKAEREGVTDPAPAEDAYLDMLARVYAAKQELRDGAGAGQADLSEIKSEPAFARFVEAQLTWDRAMAEAIATSRGADNLPLVAGLVGMAHAEHGYGVAHQLADLGIAEVEILLPAEQACAGLDADAADAVFVTGPAPESRPGPRLGVLIEDADGGIAVREVVAGSVADGAGIAAGDVIARAAGVEVGTTGDLIAIVRRQAPGTWLPVSIRRDGAEIELVAKFPPRAE